MASARLKGQTFSFGNDRRSNLGVWTRALEADASCSVTTNAPLPPSPPPPPPPLPLPRPVLLMRAAWRTCVCWVGDRDTRCGSADEDFEAMVKAPLLIGSGSSMSTVAAHAARWPRVAVMPDTVDRSNSSVFPSKARLPLRKVRRTAGRGSPPDRLRAGRPSGKSLRPPPLRRGSGNRQHRALRYGRQGSRRQRCWRRILTS